LVGGPAALWYSGTTKDDFRKKDPNPVGAKTKEGAFYFSAAGDQKAECPYFLFLLL
jgi:hypothetical protein